MNLDATGNGRRNPDEDLTSLQNLERAARVRENQRRSRARRQEHTRELEQRLAACKDEIQKKDIEHRLWKPRTNIFKSLLGSLGVSKELIQQYVQAASQGTVVARKVAIPSMQHPSGRVPSPSGGSPVSAVDRRVSVPASQQAYGPSSTPQSCSSGSTPASTPQLPPALPIAKPEEPPNPSLCCCPPGKGDSLPGGEDVLNTTLCAIAEDLINQYNVRGIDMDAIRERLWSGFTSGTPGDGCRVQNNILFQVLDEISHSI
ncbi:hypothetical protein N7470_008348 [Penicillium chermesinum]|nr:hypothetical protein N7470_008348 [Penicillium chermesinum]